MHECGSGIWLCERADLIVDTRIHQKRRGYYIRGTGVSTYAAFFRGHKYDTLGKGIPYFPSLQYARP